MLPNDCIQGIANKIFALCDNKAMLGQYFNSLLNDERGGRQGFPFGVIVNIQNLYDAMIGIPDGFIKTQRMRRDLLKFTAAAKNARPTTKKKR